MPSLDERLDRLFGTPDGASFTRLYQRIVAQPGSPVWFRSWAEEIEPTARVLRSWDPLLIPGLPQPESYARHHFSQAPQITPDEVEERVRARLRRKRILDRDDPPLIIVLIDAGVLHRKVGGAEVMRDRLDHLLEIARRPTVHIQIVDPECPTGLPGAFVITGFPDGQPDPVQVGSSAAGRITAEQDVVAVIWKRYEAIRRGLSGVQVHHNDRGSETGMDLSAAVRRKSSFSGDNGGQCAEVATNLPGAVAVRDSKDPDGPKPIFTPAEWSAFIGGVEAGESASPA
ncbi:DUF397 domain-containing protein [Planomonospora alba]|uniref:DUF397 domain-containing protein n=1 Tax=Planomonospora alba TaxID=161354 RepID=UPI0031ED8D9B